jgi:hypothetical protein
MTLDDVAKCSALNQRLTHSGNSSYLSYTLEYRMQQANDRDCWVLENVMTSGDIVGYCTGVTMDSQVLAPTEQLAMLLIERVFDERSKFAAASQLEAFVNPLQEPLTVHVPVRHSALIQWLVENGMRVEKLETVMSTCSDSPQFDGDFVYCPHAGGQ